MAKAKSKLCAMSKEPLRMPIAVCRMGLLYNKEEIIKRLIEKSIPKAFRHIQKLKDIKEAKVTSTVNKEDDSLIILCPLSQTEFNGFHHFQMIWTCGCVFSEEAAKELKLLDKCLSCGAEFNIQSDLVSLNQSPDQQLQYLHELDEKKRIEEEEKSKKKKQSSHKRKHRDEDQQEEGDDNEKIVPGSLKRQKVEEGNKSEAYKSLFSKQYEENKGADFLCRCVHRGLR